MTPAVFLTAKILRTESYHSDRSEVRFGLATQALSGYPCSGHLSACLSGAMLADSDRVAAIFLAADRRHWGSGKAAETTGAPGVDACVASACCASQA